MVVEGSQYAADANDVNGLNVLICELVKLANAVVSRASSSSIDSEGIAVAYAVDKTSGRENSE